MPKSNLSKVELIIHGKVQAVNFRNFIEHFFTNWNQLARPENQITGTIGNLKDETVGICLEGPERELEKLLPIFYLGSPSSSVSRVEENNWEKIKTREFTDFSRSN